MREAKLIETRDIPLDSVDTNNRLRPVTVSAVESLVASIEQLGRMKDEIHVRRVRHQDGKLKLIAGAHRMAAARALEWDAIPAKIWDCSDDWAELLEIDDNLAQAELSMLELAVFFAARKRVYERLHPETKQGGDRGNQFTGGKQTELSSFCQTTAEKRGITERQVRKIVAAGGTLIPDEISLLSSGHCNPTLKDLLEIAKLQDLVGMGSMRSDVIGKLADGSAKNAVEAIRSFDAEKRPVDPVEKHHQKLLDAWKRAPKEAQRRFLRDVQAVANTMLERLGGDQ